MGRWYLWKRSEYIWIKISKERDTQHTYALTPHGVTQQQLAKTERKRNFKKKKRIKKKLMIWICSNSYTQRSTFFFSSPLFSSLFPPSPTPLSSSPILTPPFLSLAIFHSRVEPMLWNSLSLKSELKSSFSFSLLGRRRGCCCCNGYHLRRRRRRSNGVHGIVLRVVAGGAKEARVAASTIPFARYTHLDPDLLSLSSFSFLFSLFSALHHNVGQGQCMSVTPF